MALPDDVAKKIAEISQVQADGYRRAIRPGNSDAENNALERCACAASNTGYFILQAYGYSHAQIKDLAR